MGREQWDAEVGRVREAGRSWAPYTRLGSAARADFERIDAAGVGYVDFRAFCAWLIEGERLAGSGLHTCT